MCFIWRVWAVCVKCVHQWICTIFRMDWLTLSSSLSMRFYLCQFLLYLFKSQRVRLILCAAVMTPFFPTHRISTFEHRLFSLDLFRSALTRCACMDEPRLTKTECLPLHPTLELARPNVLYIGKDITQENFFIDCAVCCLLNEWDQDCFVCVRERVFLLLDWILQEFFFAHLLLAVFCHFYFMYGTYNAVTLIIVNGYFCEMPTKWYLFKFFILVPLHLSLSLCVCVSQFSYAHCFAQSFRFTISFSLHSAFIQKNNGTHLNVERERECEREKDTK